MKIKHLSIVFVLSLFLFGTTKAENVDLLTAKQIGAYYFTVATGAKAPVSADNLKLAKQFDNPTLCVPALYAFNVAGNGFVVVSASDCTEPILAYSPIGHLDPENINPACQYMLDSYAKLISQNQNADATPTAEISGMWKELADQTFSCTPESKGLLIQAQWDQVEPYNYYSPKVNGVRCPAGCVATAMGMIIHYWKHPTVGGNENSSTCSYSWNGQTLRYKFLVDSNKFNYDDMPNKLTYRSPEVNLKAIGKLLFACGVTVKMGYSVDGSGAVSQDVPDAFTKWFKYAPEVTYVARHSRNNSTLIPDNEWLAMLHSEIDDHARPVYYSAHDPNPGAGRDAAGHAFVIAGSSNSSNSKFYIRWGWGGGSDGFFTLAPATSIQSASGYSFSAGHAMVYKIYPNNLGIDDNTAYTQAPCYPNPATDYLIIPSNLPLNATLVVYSADGKMVDKQVIPGGTNQFRLNLQGYAPGAYIYHLNGNAVKFTVK